MKELVFALQFKGKAQPVAMYGIASRQHGEASVVTEEARTAEVIEMTDK